MAKITQLKLLMTDSRWRKFYLQRRFMNTNVRNRIANALASHRPEVAQQPSPSVRVGVDKLQSAGLHALGQLLTEVQCGNLVKYFKSKPVQDPYRPKYPPFLPLSGNNHRDGHIAHHSATDIVNAPYLMDIANDPHILDLVSAYLGCKPTIGYMATWWSYPTSLGAQQAENYHRDVDDWRFVKLFVYLTDVDEQSGPHKYVTHSSNSSKLGRIGRFGDTEVALAFGAENILTMTSKMGEGFLEDTFGIHKGQPVKSGHRLLFQVVYTLNSLPYGPKTPVAANPTNSNFDTWINRVYLKKN